MTDLDGPLPAPRFASVDSMSYGADPVIRERCQKVREAERERWENEMLTVSNQHADEYREGFLDGYLQAYEDGDEYSCTVVGALIAHGVFITHGRRGRERQDVGV